MKGMPAEEFPLIPTLERKKPIQVASEALRQAITQTIFAAAYDNARPEISGVFFQVDGPLLTLAATDSYRLAERRVPIAPTEEKRTAIVPTRALQELLRILDNSVETVELYLTDNQLLAVVGDVELVSRLIEGQYPDYEQILPKESQTKATLPVSEFSRIIKSASLFCKTGINDVTVGFDPSGSVTVRAANSQLGEHQTSLQGEVQGQATTVIFNYRYLLDGLANLPTDTAYLQVTNAESPGLLTPTNDQPYRYLIMPIRQ
jgi:DNA polymerase-3 subunit beta